MADNPPILHLRPVPNLEIFLTQYGDDSGWNGRVRAAVESGQVPQHIRHVKRQIEWVVLQHLLKIAGVNELAYLPTGKPEVIGPEYISISHGDGLAGIALASVQVGMDIQHPDPKLMRIRKKFCSEAELAFCDKAETPLQALTIIWAAKEAVFKYYGERIHFARDIAVQPFDPDDESISAHYSGVHGEKDFTLVHHVLSGHHCLCTRA
jgi:phosphopantetheinyl transferase